MLNIGKITLGQVPRIVVSVTDQDGEDALRAAAPDVLEVRADLAGEMSLEAVRRRVEGLSRLGIPLIFTARNDPAEGGTTAISDEHKAALFERVIGLVDAVDIELNSPLRDQVVALARRHQRIVMVSAHDFRQTPDDENLVKILDRGRDSGADLVKIAMFARNPDDLRRLAAFTLRFRERNLVTVSLGAIGTISRLAFPLLGSLLTFSYLGQATAPGQIPLDELRADLRRYSPDYERQWLSPREQIR